MTEHLLGTAHSKPPRVVSVRKSDITVRELIAAADAIIPRVTPAEAQEMMREGIALVVDVRDASEIERSGKIAGALNVSRGMLEFRADPESPYHYKAFVKDKTVVLYCASGGRSALAGKTLKDMGYSSVFNLGAFGDWVETGGAVERS